MTGILPLKNICRAVAMSVAMVLFASCENSFIFENEGDCTVKYRVNFVYDMNLKWADAFPSEVKSVNLYIFDSEGLFYKEFSASGVALENPGFYIELDGVPAGDYELVAWCGLVNDDEAHESFTVTNPVKGVTTLDDFVCRLNTMSTKAGEEDGSVVSDSMLNFLYHGNISVNLPDSNDGLIYYYTIPLTKDTNHIRIILQELASDEDMNPADYEISIEAADGVMAYNNDLLPSPAIKYEPWSQVQDEVGVGRVDVVNGEVKFVKGIIADLSVARIMADMKENFNLVIKRTDNGEVIVSVPIVQYALLAKSYYESAYKHKLTNQELLDREDEYVMTFFLEKGKWLDSYIDILQWRIVFHDYGIGDQ